MNKIINCPTCDTGSEWDIKNEFRPFCSERCKLIDLGAWANEEYSVATEPASPLEDIKQNDGYNQ